MSTFVPTIKAAQSGTHQTGRAYYDQGYMRIEMACYIGSAVQPLPQSNAPIDMDRFGDPTLMVEIGATSFSDDLGRKRLLYEQLGVEEYWVVNSQSKNVIAFAIA